MIRTTLATVVFTLLATTASQAQEAATTDAAPIQVSEAVTAAAIENREPAGVAEAFPADVGTVYFYTVLEGDFAETQIEHVWLRDGQEVARVPLRVQGPRWRTWSSKRIPSDWAGSWVARVEVADGQVLSSVQFTVGA